MFGYYINIDKTRATGVEAKLNANLTDTLTASLNWTNMTATNTLTGTRFGPPAAEPRQRRPHLAAPAGNDARQPASAIRASGSTTQAISRRLTSNTTVNLFGSYDLTEKWQLFGRIDNLFNDRTEQVTGFGVPGLAAYGGVRAAF